MITSILTAAPAGGAAEQFGFFEAMNQGGVVAWGTFTVLVIMSVGSFYIMFTKLFEQQKIMNQAKRVRAGFWNMTSLRDGASKLEQNSAYRQIVDDGLAAQEQHGKLTDPVEAHDWLHGSLARSEQAINSKLGTGLAFLATVGATAPFIGLFGTVVGIYRALITIGASGDPSIDKVAGPVGEALIMTALGLAVAVPAVLAYNWLQRRNKAIAEDLSAFSNDVLGYMASDGHVRPGVGRKPAATGTPATSGRPAPAAATTGAAAGKPAATTTAGQTGGVQTKP